ncbi:MAG: hypothetical protein D6722_19415, partial [Bacteroidetes bacterium]
MRSAFILSLFLLTTIGLLPAQSGRTIFADEFNSNQHGWWTGDIESGTNAIRNGKLYLLHKRESQSWTPTITISEVDVNQDFDIEASFYKISGAPGNSYGLTWGGSSKTQRFDFTISGNGYFSLGKVDGPGDRIKLVDWKKSSSIREGDRATNVIRIEKRGNTHRFFINNDMVLEHHMPPLYGQHTGFTIYRNVAVEVDYLRITAPVDSMDAVNVFTDNFSNNNNNWWTGSIDNGENALRSGAYYMNHRRTEKSWVPLITIDAVDLTHDFQVETR